MNNQLTILGCAALSWAVCWLWHAAREQRWPGFATARGAAIAPVLAWSLLAVQGLILAAASSGIALILTLPLASLTLAAPVYVALYHAWPARTARAALGVALLGCILIIMGSLAP